MDSVTVDELKASCSKMHGAFPSNPYPLEKLAEIILIKTVGEHEFLLTHTFCYPCKCTIVYFLGHNG